MCLSSHNHVNNNNLLGNENQFEDEIDQEKEEMCSECRSPDIIMDYTRSEKICSICGIVLEERIINQALSTEHFKRNSKR